MRDFLKDIQSQHKRGVIFVWERTDKKESYIRYHSIGRGIAYVSDELDSAIKATGRIYYDQNSHRENVNMINELVTRIKG